MIEKKMMVKAVTVVLGLAVVLFMSPLAAEAGDVAYWSFDEGSGATAADSVGTNDMQASGWTTGGYSDDAIDFSSPSNGYALRSSSVSSALDLTEAVTVDLRMKLSAAIGGTSILFQKNDASGRDYALKVTSDNKFYGYIGDNYVRSTAATLNTGTWYHVQFAYNKYGTYANIYLDGAKITDSHSSSVTTWGAIPTNADYIRVGKKYNGSEAFAAGIIDEVKIRRPGVVAHWKFDEGSGATAADSVGTNDMQAGGWTTDGYSDDAIDFSNGGYALRSSGVSSALDLTEAVTVDLRMKLSTAIGGTSMLFQKDDAGGRDYELKVTSDNKFYGYIGGNYVRSTAATLDTGTWYHVQFAYDDLADQVKIFLDGTDITDSTSSSVSTWGAIPTDADYIRAGKKYSGAEAFTAGIIDEVKIYDGFVPEPATMTLLLLGLPLALRRRR